MGNALFGFTNRVLTGALTAGSEASGLLVGNLQSDQGAASAGWQTASGALSPSAGAWFQVDAGSAATWRAMCLARTNLSTSAQVRWRIGPDPTSFAGPAALGVDSAAGASIGANTTRVGTTATGDGSTGVVYRNSSTSLSFVSRAATLLAGVTYTVKVRAQRISGTGTTGQIISAAYNDGTGAVRANVAMSAVPATGWVELSTTFTNQVGGSYNMFFFTGTGAVGDVAIWSASIEAVPAYDSGTISAGIAASVGQSVTVAPAQVSGRYCRCDITDTSNPDGFINVPLAYAGPVWQISPINIAPASAFGIDESVDEVVTRGGQEYPDLRFQRRRWSVVVESLAGADLWPNFLEWLRVSRIGRNVLFVPDPDVTARHAETVFGRAKIAADIAYTTQVGDRRQVRAQVTERL